MTNKTQELGIPLNRDLLAEGLMQADFDARVASGGLPISAGDIATYHRAVFIDQNLPESTWTESRKMNYSYNDHSPHVADYRTPSPCTVEQNRGICRIISFSDPALIEYTGIPFSTISPGSPV